MTRKLLFDLEATQPIDNMQRHGGGKYAECIFYRLIERDISFACFYNSKKWINPELLEAINERGIILYDTQERSIDEIVELSGATSLFSAIPTSVSSIKGCEVFGTIHDLRSLEVPYDRYFYKYRSLCNSIKEKVRFFVKSQIPEYARRLTTQSYLDNYFNTPMHIITVSEHSEYEIKSYIPQAKDRDIRVFYSPNTSSKIPAAKVNGGEKYFLSVSGSVWIKNVLRAIMAFDRLVSEGMIKDMKYIITGANPSSFKYKIKNPGAFVFLGYVDDSELEQLYANAYAFVYPSLSEGFGYPPLEAMRYRVPVIASPISSISQILDTGALYFNPFSVEEIMNRMLMILIDDYHKAFAERGYQRYLVVKERQEKDLDKLIDYIVQ